MKTNKTKKLFKNMMSDESKAPGEYMHLRKRLKPADKKVINSIIHDERKHLRLLKKIKRRYN